MGFILGMVLAGIGGISAKTAYFLKSKSEETKRLESFWSETGIGYKEVSQLVTNQKCHSSQKYFNACINSVLQNSMDYNLKISPVSGQLIRLQLSDRFEEKSERELLQSFLQKEAPIDFDKSIQQLMSLEAENKRPALAANLINSFLSVYFDPHTYILPEQFYDDVGAKIERSKFFVGISYEKRNGFFYVQKVSKNSDAELAGLKSRDKIIAINGTRLRDLPYSAVSRILKDESAQELNFEIVRGTSHELISLKRSYRKLNHVQYNAVAGSEGLGLLTLSKFNPGVCAEIATLLKKMSSENLTGLILDLRDNPGGLLSEASCIAGLFLGKNKKAYYVEYFDALRPNEVVLTSEKQHYQGPLMVLVNSTSASASELLAGGLQEYRRAYIIGETTFGKGTFQEPEEWGQNSKVSLFKTQGFYLLPSRNSTQILGVKPDYEIKTSQRAKSEGHLFFNPVAARSFTYSQLKKSEVESSYLFSENCLKSKKIQLTDDVYLDESHRRISCIKNKKELTTLAQSAISTLN